MYLCTCCMAALTPQGIVQLQHFPIFSLKQGTQRLTLFDTRFTIMSVTTHANVQTGSALNALFSDWKAAIARRFAFRKTLRELDALTNRELADLGLQRSELRRVAYQAAYEAN